MTQTPKLPDDFFSVDFRNTARHADCCKECIRLIGLRLLQKGLSELEAADLLDVHVETVREWLRKFKKGGIERLKDQGGRGRKKLLPSDLESDFRDAVIKQQGNKSGGSITGHDIQRMLEADFHIECSLSTVYNDLHNCGLSWISGRTQHPQKDPAEQENFKKTLKQRFWLASPKK